MGASQPSRTTGTNFLYIYIYRRPPGIPFSRKNGRKRGIHSRKRNHGFAFSKKCPPALYVRWLYMHLLGPRKQKDSESQLKERAKQFSEVFYADEGMLFCKFFDHCLDFMRIRTRRKFSRLCMRISPPLSRAHAKSRKIRLVDKTKQT